MRVRWREGLFKVLLQFQEAVTTCFGIEVFHEVGRGLGIPVCGGIVGWRAPCGEAVLGLRINTVLFGPLRSTHRLEEAHLDPNEC